MNHGPHFMSSGRTNTLLHISDMESFMNDGLTLIFGFKTNLFFTGSSKTTHKGTLSPGKFPVYTNGPKTLCLMLVDVYWVF